MTKNHVIYPLLILLAALLTMQAANSAALMKAEENDRGILQDAVQTALKGTVIGAAVGSIIFPLSFGVDTCIVLAQGPERYPLALITFVVVGSIGPVVKLFVPRLFAELLTATIGASAIGTCMIAVCTMAAAGAVIGAVFGFVYGIIKGICRKAWQETPAGIIHKKKRRSGQKNGGKWKLRLYPG